jgi:outer membrane protein assembly factor BamB
VAALLTAACAQVHPQRSGLDDQPAATPDAATQRTPPASSCPQSPAIPHQGAPASLGLHATSLQPPLWSSAIGDVAALEGQTVFTTTGSSAECVLAVNATTGRPVWNWSAPTHPQVMAVTASAGTVIAATGHTSNTPAAMPLVDHLTALDAATGHQLWTLALADHGDGQSVPAAITGNTVIVTQANGTVQGTDAKTGTPRWKDPLPPTCHPNTQDPASSPIAAILTAASDPTILYQCAHADELTALTPATGALRWTWRAPGGWSVNTPPEVATTAGVTALTGDGPGPATTATTNHRIWPLGPRGYDPVQIVAIDDSTGRPLWELDDVAASADVYAGNGQICPASPYGVECLNARTGAESWQWRPAVTPSQEPGTSTGFAAAAGSRLYFVAPTPAAAKINSESTTQRSAPGTFTLQARDITTGHLIATRPLPSYYGGDSGVVASLDTPPGVAAVTGSTVLVTPEHAETYVVEAFDMMAG